MFLSRSWYAFDGTVESGAQYNILLDELLKGLFKKSDLVKITNYLQWTQVEAKQLKQKSSTLKTFPCFTKYTSFQEYASSENYQFYLFCRGNFPLFYRALGSALIKSITESAEKSGPTAARLRLWEQACDLLNTLLSVASCVEILRTKILFLKVSETRFIFISFFSSYYRAPDFQQMLRSNYCRSIDCNFFVENIRR